MDDVETVASLHARSQKTLNRHQRFMERVTAQVGRPRTIYMLVVVAGAWVVANSMAPTPIDPPPFYWLQGALCLYAALVTTIVVTTQNRQQRHAEERAYLDLQINVIAEQKTAKLIALLEELRRDIPTVRDRTDPEAETMSRAVDPENVLSALEETLEGEDDDEP